VRKATLLMSTTMCLGAVCMLPSCSHITMLRIEELQAVESHVDSLKAELAALQQDIAKEQKKQSELLRLIRADQQVQSNELKRELSNLSSTIYDSQDKLLKIDQKTQEIKRRWEEKAMADSMAVASRNTEIENLFNVAHSDFTAGRYDVALSGFQDIIDRFPGVPQAEGASYWKAECYYAQKSYEEAEKAFIMYIKSYPEGKKICVALFKLGLVYDNTKRVKSRQMVWDKLLSQCPDSEEAKAVKARR
jgi:TolA-binding protein